MNEQDGTHHDREGLIVSLFLELMRTFLPQSSKTSISTTLGFDAFLKTEEEGRENDGLSMTRRRRSTKQPGLLGNNPNKVRKTSHEWIQKENTQLKTKYDNRAQRRAASTAMDRKRRARAGEYMGRVKHQHSPSPTLHGLPPTNDVNNTDIVVSNKTR